MTTDDTSETIEATARTLGLAIAPEWKANVLMFFEVARTMARMIEATGAVTSAEAAPVFSPRSEQ